MQQKKKTCVQKTHMVQLKGGTETTGRPKQPISCRLGWFNCRPEDFWVLCTTFAPSWLRGLHFRMMAIIINTLLDMEHCRGRKTEAVSHPSLTNQWNYFSALKQSERWGGRRCGSRAQRDEEEGEDKDKLTFWEPACFSNILNDPWDGQCVGEPTDVRIQMIGTSTKRRGWAAWSRSYLRCHYSLCCPRILSLCGWRTWAGTSTGDEMFRIVKSNAPKTANQRPFWLENENTQLKFSEVWKCFYRFYQGCHCLIKGNKIDQNSELQQHLISWNKKMNEWMMPFSLWPHAWTLRNDVTYCIFCRSQEVREKRRQLETQENSS